MIKLEAESGTATIDRDRGRIRKGLDAFCTDADAKLSMNIIIFQKP